MTCRVRLRFSSNLLILCSIFSSHLSPSPPPVGTLGAGWDSRPCCHLLLLQPICAGAAAQHWASLRPSRVWGGHRVLSTACRAAAAQSCSLVMQGCWGHCHSRTRPLVLGTQLGPGVWWSAGKTGIFCLLHCVSLKLFPVICLCVLWAPLFHFTWVTLSQQQVLLWTSDFSQILKRDSEQDLLSGSLCWGYCLLRSTVVTRAEMQGKRASQALGFVGSVWEAALLPGQGDGAKLCSLYEATVMEMEKWGLKPCLLLATLCTFSSRYPEAFSMDRYTPVVPRASHQCIVTNFKSHGPFPAYSRSPMSVNQTDFTGLAWNCVDVTAICIKSSPSLMFVSQMLPWRRDGEFVSSGNLKIDW